MKNKVINGKMYDTATAKHLASVDEPDYESLHRKENGEYFISSEFEIVPVSEEEARRWSERHLTGDEYVAIFGKVPE